MAIPKYFEFFAPVMECLLDEKEHSTKDIRNYCVSYYSITEEELQERLTSGQYKYSNRIAWAEIYLKNAGLIESPSRSKYIITTLGKQAAKNGVQNITLKYLTQFESFRQFKGEKEQKSIANSMDNSTCNDSESPELSLQDPQEQLDTISRQLNESLAINLMQKVLKMSPYDFEKAKLVVKEMTDQMVLDLVDKKLVTDQIVLTVGYDIENLNNPDRRKKYHGEVTIDRYGRRIPKHAHGTTNLKRQTSSTKMITDAVIELYDGIVDRNLLIRRINITANRLVDENSVKKEKVYEQLDLFTDYEAQRKKQEEEEAALDREKRMQEAMLSIKKKFGKNAMLKGMNLQEGATARDRNEQIGGHKA